MKSRMRTKPDRLSRRSFLLASGVATLGLCTANRTVHASARPNVLWIVNDASRARNYSCYGYDRKTSPNIDSLAARGVLFESTSRSLLVRREFAARVSRPSLPALLRCRTIQ